MATTVARLEAVLTANTRPFEQAMDKSHTKMQKIGKVAGIAGLAIAGGLAYGLEKSVHAAMEAQVATARLDQAFKTSGISAVKNAKAVDALEKSGRKLGFTDEQTKNALGSLLIATHSMTKASADLNVAQDIARFKHVDLTAATKMLTMAQAGSQRATKQLGLNVTALTVAQDKAKEAYHASLDALDENSGALRKGTAAQQEQFSALKNNIDTVYAGNLAVAKMTDKQATAAKVIDLVRDKLHGQADAYSKTAAGGMEQFRAQLDHLEVSFGTALLPLIAKVTGALASLLDWFSRHNAVAKITIGIVGALGAAFLLTSAYAKVMASSLVTKLIPALRASTAAMFGLDTAMDANPIGAVIIALAAFGIALVIAYKKVAFFRNGVNATFNWIKQNWPLLVGIIGGPIGLALEQIITKRNQIAAAFQALPGMIGNAIGGAMHFLKEKITALFNPGKIKKWILDALGFGSPSPFFVDIGKQIITSIAHGVGAYSGILKDAVFGLAKSIPGKALGAVGGAAHAVLGSGGKQPPVYNKGGLVPQVVNALSYAQSHGWRGSVTSGYRSYAEQARLYDNYLHHGGPLAAKPGTSSHERGQAVDVTDYGTFGRIMASAPSWERLYNKLGNADPVHFSVSGYAKGGIAGLNGPEIARVGEKGPEAIIPLTQAANSFAGMTWVQKMKEFMQRVWSVAAPFYGGGSMPIVDFLAPGTGMGGAQIEGEGAWGTGKYPPVGKRRILWPAELTQALYGIRGKDIDPRYSLANLRQWALNTLLHEWTHAFQGRSATSQGWRAEGGAVDFVKMFGQKIYSMLGINYDSGFSSGAIYEGYAKRVMKQLGPNWIAKGQFKTFDRGGWLMPGLTLAANNTGRPERIGGGGLTVNIHAPGYLGDEGALGTAVMDILQSYQNRNGRPAYGSGF